LQQVDTTEIGCLFSIVTSPTFLLEEDHGKECSLTKTLQNWFFSCSVASKGDQFLWAASNMGVASSLMLPVTQEMAEEESKQQGGMNRQATAVAAAKGDPPVVTMAQPEPEGFSEV
jgi:hypothetical protein